MRLGGSSCARGCTHLMPAAGAAGTVKVVATLALPDRPPHLVAWWALAAAPQHGRRSRRSACKRRPLCRAVCGSGWGAASTQTRRVQRCSRHRACRRPAAKGGMGRGGRAQLGCRFNCAQNCRRASRRQLLLLATITLPPPTLRKSGQGTPWYLNWRGSRRRAFSPLIEDGAG